MRSGKFFVVLALVFATGLHWVALQTVAWTTMLAASLGNESFSEAVAQTFDGEHPCPLCKVIAAGKKSENKSVASVLKLKLEFPPVAEKMILIAPKLFPAFSPANISPGSFLAKPPVPPPRGCFV